MKSEQFWSGNARCISWGSKKFTRRKKNGKGESSAIEVEINIFELIIVKLISLL